MMVGVLGFVARHGRICLIAGLLAGLLLPSLAQILRPWLPQLVAFLLFITAIRIGPKAAFGRLGDIRFSMAVALVFQFVLPLTALAVFTAFGVAAAPLAIVLVLMLSAPSVTGSPNFSIMLGHDPTPAMRLLIVGTAMLPITVLPILWLVPGVGDPGQVIAAAFWLFTVIAGAVAAGFAVRYFIWSKSTNEGLRALDGVAALSLAIVVIGLMSALGPALADNPLNLLAWLAAAVGANFGLQTACFFLLGRTRSDAVAVSIIAGNRNIALFLVALPQAVTDPLLIFIGCYQVPMYLTPVLMRYVYGRDREG